MRGPIVQEHKVKELDHDLELLKDDPTGENTSPWAYHFGDKDDIERLRKGGLWEVEIPIVVKWRGLVSNASTEDVAIRYAETWIKIYVEEYVEELTRQICCGEIDFVGVGDIE